MDEIFPVEVSGEVSYKGEDLEHCRKYINYNPQLLKSPLLVDLDFLQEIQRDKVINPERYSTE